MSEEIEEPQRDDKGRWLPGHRGGPGRKRVRPLRDVVTWDEEAKLWEAHLELAQTDTSAREFVLKYTNGNPVQAAPDLPPIAWPRVMRVEDILPCLDAIMQAQAAGDLSSEGMKFLIGLVQDIAKVIEIAQLAPEVAALKAQVEALVSAGKLQPVGAR